MLFQDSGCTAASVFLEFERRGLYAVLQAEGSAILAMSGRREMAVEGAEARNGLDVRLCELLCRRSREAIWEISGAEGLACSGVHMAVCRLGGREGVRSFAVFFRRSLPFSAAELAWLRSFLELYREKALLFRDLRQANELLGRMGAGEPPRIFIRAFGRFDVFAGGRLVDFPSAKAKELLALCVDHCGGGVTMEEAVDKLWENRAYDQRSKNLYRKAVSHLRRVFEALGRGEVFSSARGRCHLNRELVDCDYFRYLDGEPVRFTGEYLSSYPWAEETNAWLARRQGQG